jgi:hypothetical protein
VAVQWINVSEQAGLQKSIVFTRGGSFDARQSSVFQHCGTICLTPNRPISTISFSSNKQPSRFVLSFGGQRHSPGDAIHICKLAAAILQRAVDGRT